MSKSDFRHSDRSLKSLSTFYLDCTDGAEGFNRQNAYTVTKHIRTMFEPTAAGKLTSAGARFVS